MVYIALLVCVRNACDELEGDDDDDDDGDDIW